MFLKQRTQTVHLSTASRNDRHRTYRAQGFKVRNRFGERPAFDTDADGLGPPSLKSEHRGSLRRLILGRQNGIQRDHRTRSARFHQFRKR